MSLAALFHELILSAFDAAIKLASLNKKYCVIFLAQFNKIYPTLIPLKN